MNASAETAVETFRLCRQFGDLRAVDNLDLRVEPGTLYGFLGRNGAGKSTTIKMLTGLLAPSSGTIRMLGRNPLDPVETIDVKRRVGVVPEDLALYDLLTGRENLTFVGRMYRVDRDVAQDRIDELFALLELGIDASEEKRLVIDYSHGMKKKLALAAALIANPELLFLDEPFEGVDAVTSRVIRDLLRRVAEQGATIFITSHVLEIVERLCSHVGIIDRGRLVAQAPLSEIQQTSTLEETFLAKVGSTEDVRANLSWLDEGEDGSSS
ncbi:MAG: ABC transporter ATP-binding protein [Gammaproteobacteria bacterium]|nr:ABC transporter ATP-binding protein [Gammaproteobacteria bacterium]MXY55174.1 ABC transporter ATP-binding protein [Gammaproteobacteria bacterium]MYF31546.1 ABC transporter ATP-binding protein [Gammaproteobacteria bacterium]MYK47063.1 ABC transporter ATP-binding protein [Gammaproteobacteria bacterium]